MKANKKIYMAPVNSVPCSWCGDPMDLREVYREILNNAGAMGGAIDQIEAQATAQGMKVNQTKNPWVTCDNCNRPTEILGIDKRPRIRCRQKH